MPPIEDACDSYILGLWTLFLSNSGLMMVVVVREGVNNQASTRGCGRVCGLITYLYTSINLLSDV